MPTRLKSRGRQWQARVYLEGRQVASRLFPPGRKNGPEWRAAKEWEEQQRRILEENQKVDSDSEIFVHWLKLYLEHAWRTMTEKTAKEKAAVLDDFADFCLDKGIIDPGQVSPQTTHEFLTGIYDTRGGHVANKYRKNLLVAWNWGAEMLDNFPDKASPFGKVKPFKVVTQDRYVPPDEDVTAVLAQVSGQDAIMLTAFIQTGARRNELFKLTWRDVDLKNRRIRLTDRKGLGGFHRERWRTIDKTLADALQWWYEVRPAKVDNVFMLLANYETKNRKTGETISLTIGDRFQVRQHFMKNLCRRAGVKPFGFHALRHKGAATLYVGKSLNEVQIFLGHHKATTTDRYVKSAGLFTGGDELVKVIIESSIGRVACEQLKKVMAS